MINYFYMEDIIYQKVLNLKEALSNNKDIQLLEKLEKEMLDNDQFKILAYRLDMSSLKYNDSLKHNENKETQKKLYNQMMDDYHNLHNLTIVKQYDEQYLKVKKIYQEINKNIFDDFKQGLNFK